MKAIITNLDRTLLRTDKSVSGKTISVLKKVQKNGIKVMFATARPGRTAVGTLFQIMNRSATKLNGVKAMLDAFGIEPEAAVYFCDDNDDIESLKWCGI